mgnify:CR=1 FL=1
MRDGKQVLVVEGTASISKKASEKGFQLSRTIAYEKAFLESIILFQIETRLLPQGGELDSYLEKFNLKAEEEARRY